MKVLIAGAADERVEAALADVTTERAESLAAIRKQASAADAVVASADDTVADEVAAAVERAAPGTPVLRADQPGLKEAVHRAVQANRYREAVDDLYQVARERARPDPDKELSDDALDQALANADEAFQRAREVDGLTPYDAVLTEHTAPEADDEMD